MSARDNKNMGHFNDRYVTTHDKHGNKIVVNEWCCYCDYCNIGECSGAADTICLTPNWMYLSHCINHKTAAEEHLLEYLLTHPSETVVSCE